MSSFASIGRRNFLKSTALGGLGGLALMRGAPSAFAANGTVNMHTWSAAVDLVQSHLNAFEEKTGLETSYSNSPWAQYRETMVTRFVGGAPLDVMWVSDSWLPEWVEAGWITPVDEYDFLMKYNEDASDFCTNSMIYNGRQYGLTYYTDFMGFLYNARMLEEAGISSPPQSWDEVIEQSLKIKQQGIADYPVMLAMAQESWLIEFMSAMVFSHGGRFTDDNGDALMADSEQGCVSALRWIVDAVHEHGIVNPGCVETGELQGLKAFAGGSHAFALLPKYRLRMLNDPEQSSIAGNAKQALMPAGEGGSHATVGWMRFHGMAADAKASEERAQNAARLIEWFGGKAEGEYRFQKLLFLDIGAGFGVEPLFDDPEIRDAYDQYADVEIIREQQAVARKKDVIAPWFGEWNETNGSAWQEAILQNASPEEALQRSADSWDELKSSY